MSKLIYPVVILLVVIALVLQAYLYRKKVRKAYENKTWEALPRLIFNKNAIFGFVIPASYYRDMLKYIIESGNLFSDQNKKLVDYCEQKGYGLEEAKPYLLLRELILQKNLPRELLEETNKPLNNALLSCARGDAGGFITEILTRPPENDNLRTLCAALAIKMGYINIPIDEKMRSSVYANLLTGGIV